jgi:hypothetical protein
MAKFIFRPPQNLYLVKKKIVFRFSNFCCKMERKTKEEEKIILVFIRTKEWKTLH